MATIMNPISILVVEDKVEDYLLLKGYLQNMRPPLKKIIHAVNMESVYSLINNYSFDVVLIDLSLPDGSGIESITTIRKILTKTALIVLAGQSSEELALQSIAIGVQDYLIKGDFDNKLLAKTIQHSIERKKIHEKILADQLINQQKLITETTILAQEKERNEIGKELHDNINQILATVKLYLGMMKNNQKDMDQFLLKASEYVDAAIEEIRKLSRSLVSPSLGNITLHQSLKDLVTEVNKTNSLQIKLKYNIEDNITIGSKKELMIYRVVQEQINNILKHAKAKSAKIEIKIKDGNLLLTTSDNGVGFNTSDRSKGIGLQNISTRIGFYEGKLDIISAPGKGCKFKITIPC